MKRIAFFVLGALLLGSCSDMGDSLKDFVTEETVYPAKFDKADAYTGYENVVIDLLNNVGRDVPASQIHLARATKTVVEYGDTVLVIDSVCSSVKITGLTQPAIYKFTISSMDEHGNKSLPMEVSQAPFTAADKELLVIPAPVIEHLGGGDVKVEWKQNITSILLTYLDKLVYSVGRGGAQVTLDGTTQQPSFIANVAVGDTLHMQYRVKPKVSNMEILDEIWLERPLVIPAP
ncbi:hypothetical protein SAMD00024442_15_34 [Candidatus Symbiothrix dinenymphae]|nr:hypothetical protein SAMD00024442_15_34 [Candidatus Symbiothrix dinenymphae]